MGKKKASMANERSSILLLPPPTACNQWFFFSFFWRIFATWPQKKKGGLANPAKAIFEIFLKKCAIS
jgi:hypothetical protein